MSYEMDMSQEKEPVRNDKFDEGRHEFVIHEVEPSMSKKGNEMFIVTLKQEATNKKIQCYLVATPGKRWMLKQLLSSVGIDKNAEGKYSWDIKDVLGKNVVGIIENVDEEYIDRQGESKKVTKPKVVAFESTQIAWDDDK